LAAKKPAEDPGLAPDVNNGTDFRGNVSYSMDLGTPDKAFTCASCHSGGIMEFDRDSGKRHDEISDWDDAKDGTGFFSNATYSDSEVDGDAFSYTPDEYSRGYLGKPHKFNWKKSGVLDTDCFLCHADRSQNLSVKTGMWRADNPTPANPRVFIFEKKDAEGKVVEISLGFPPSLTPEEAQNGYTVDSVAFYSTPMERIVSLYYMDVVQLCLQNSGLDLSDQQLAMQAQSLTIAIITESLKHGITTGFTIPYSQLGGTDFTYNDNNRLSTFSSTFFIDPGAPNFSARDYLRNAFFESTVEGQPYVGAGMFLRATTINDMFSYNPMDMSNPKPFVNLGRAGFFFGWADAGTLMAVADPNDASRPLAFVKLERQEDGTFKAVTYYAKDADLSSVKLPILETSGHYTLCKADDSKEAGVSKFHSGDRDDELTLMCAQCHFAIPDRDNRWFDMNGNSYPSWYVRRGIIGMGADVVKRAAVFSREAEGDTTDAPIFVNPDGTIADPNTATAGLPSGYDVHFAADKGNLSCLSCHGQDNLSDEEKLHHNPHNFLKGNDPAGEVMPALDYNPSLQTCTKCHWGSDAAAAKEHEAYFGPAASVHINSMMCQVCHIPYKTYWSFRFFNDLVGYSNQFDNRFMKFVVDNGNVTMYQFPPEWAIPAFSPSPTYGVNYAFTITQTTDDGGDAIVPMTMIDMDPNRALMRWNDDGSNFGMWATGADPQMKPFLFPWRWAPTIIKRHTIDDNGNDVVKAGLINPITVATWVDASTGRSLFVRELHAAVKGLAPVGGSTIDPEPADKEVPAITMVPASQAEADTGKTVVSMKDANGNDTGMVAAVQLINGKFVYDNDGDMVPEIDSDYEYDAMKDALTQVLNEEDPNHPHNPVIFLGIAPFGIDHGVLPAKYALGAQKSGPLSCNACHNSDESKNRYSPAVKSGDFNAGRFVTLAPFALPEKAIEESKAYGGWRVPEGVTTVKTPDGREIMGLTQGALAQFESVTVESKEYAAFALVTVEGGVTSQEGITVSVPAGAVDTPTIIKIEKVEKTELEESAIEKAREEGIKTPVLASEILDIHTKTNKFAKPIQITLKYDPEKVSGKVVVLSSEDGKTWTKVGEFDVDPQNPYVQFSRTDLSYFAIVGTASTESYPEAETTTAGGGGGGCSIAPATSPVSGIINFLLMGLGAIGLRFRRKRN